MRGAISYLDFDLLIRQTDRGYRAQVLSSPAGEATADFTAPFSDLELENFLLRVGRPRRGTRRIGSPEMEAVKTLGKGLYEAVFSGDVRACWRSSLSEAEAQDVGLRLRLRIADAPGLNDIPWEYLYNPSLNRFLSLSEYTPLIRYLDLPERIRPLTVDARLEILVMISSPTDYPGLDVEHEWSRLNEALAGLTDSGQVRLERLTEARLPILQRKLRGGEYHILHFIGHGGFDRETQDGVLVLCDEAGKGRLVAAEHLGTILHDHRSLRLVVLNACEGSRSSRSDPFGGIAQTLVQQGVPAVIAMQFEITDQAAITFAEEFYAAMADGYPVDAALSAARKAIFAVGNDIEWGTPVLYLRAPNGQLFTVNRDAKAARQAEEEKQRAEAARLAEEDKQRAEAARLAEEDKQRAEAARLAEEDKQRAEAARLAEEDKQRAEAARLAEEDKQRAEAARLAEEDKQRAEAARLAEEDKQRAEAARLAEEDKQRAEAARLAEEDKQRAEAARLAEEDKQRAEAARLAEEDKQRAEAARLAEEDKQRAEAARLAEEDKQRAEAARLAEEDKQRAEATRLAEEDKQRAEAARLAEEDKQRAEAARLAEEDKQRAEAARQAEEDKQRAEAARLAEEEKRRTQAARQAEEEKQRTQAARQAEEEKRRAEAARLAEEAKRRAEAARQAEEKKRQAEAARGAEEERQRQRQRAEAARQAEEKRQREEAARPAEEQRQLAEAAPRFWDGSRWITAEEEQRRAEAARPPAEEKQRAEAARQAADEKRRGEAARQAEEEKRRGEAARRAEEEMRRAEAARRAEEEKRRAEAAQRTGLREIGRQSSFPDLILWLSCLGCLGFAVASAWLLAIGRFDGWLIVGVVFFGFLGIFNGYNLLKR